MTTINLYSNNEYDYNRLKYFFISPLSVLGHSLSWGFSFVTRASINQQVKKDCQPSF